MAIAGLKNLCSPSYVYLVLSIIALIFMAIQNYGNINVYCLGSYSCVVSSTLLIFLIKIVYVLFWTWILNLMCRAGATTFSWFLVLFPFILFLAIIFVTMIGK
jgi:hypothetical protein